MPGCGEVTVQRKVGTLRGEGPEELAISRDAALRTDLHRHIFKPQSSRKKMNCLPFFISQIAQLMAAIMWRLMNTQKKWRRMSVLFAFINTF